MTFTKYLKTHLRAGHLPVIALLGGFIVIACFGNVAGQTTETVGNFPVGERLTYSISMEKFQNVAYAEIFAASTGQIGGRDAVEIRLRFRTVSFASAAFFLVDESRVTYAAVDTGLPVFIRRTEMSAGLPTEKVIDHTGSPTSSHDLATLIYALRRSGGSGSLLLEEDGKAYQVTFQASGSGRVTTDAGDFETTVVSVQSEFFTERGLNDVLIDLANDSDKTPVSFRFRTDRGRFTANIASIQKILPKPEATSTPTPEQTPRPTPTPAPSPTPRVYQPNQPISADLAFVLGERIRMRVTRGDAEVGTITLRAAERTEFQGRDTLLLSATVTDTVPNEPNLRVNDTMWVRVDPETLSPQFFENRFSGSLAGLSQSGSFDTVTSAISITGGGSVDAPFGTHTVLSLLYAMRSFNLKPSIVVDSPVNDTRVAVFWADKPTVFSLRPSDADIIRVSGERVTGQLITINTQIPQLDALAPKVWLGNDPRRLPLRIVLGNYQFDLIDSIIEIPR